MNGSVTSNADMRKWHATVVKWHYKGLWTHSLAEAGDDDKADNVQKSGKKRAKLVVYGTFKRARTDPEMSNPPVLWLGEDQPRSAVELVIFLLFPVTAPLVPCPCPTIETSTKTTTLPAPKRIIAQAETTPTLITSVHL